MPNNSVLLSPGQVLSIRCIKQWLKAVSGDVACAIPTAVIQRAAVGICHEVDNLILRHDGEEAELTVRNLEQAVIDGSPMVLWANMGSVEFLGFKLFSPTSQQEAALASIMGGHDFEGSRIPKDTFA